MFQENDILPDLLKWRSRLLRMTDGYPDYEDGDTEAQFLTVFILELNKFLGHIQDDDPDTLAHVMRRANKRLIGLGWWVLMLAVFLRF